MASKSDKARKNEDTYGEASDVVDRIVYKAFQSFRDERIPRKELAKRLGLSAEIIRNMERGHRKMTVSDLILFSRAMEKEPDGVLKEIIRRFEGEITNLHKKTGY